MGIGCALISLVSMIILAYSDNRLYTIYNQLFVAVPLSPLLVSFTQLARKFQQSFFFISASAGFVVLFFALDHFEQYPSYNPILNATAYLTYISLAILLPLRLYILILLSIESICYFGAFTHPLAMGIKL